MANPSTITLTSLAMTAFSGNFIRAVPIAAALSMLMVDHTSLDRAGIYYAVASGALACGIGCAIWYTALPA